jgi:hypothetical protein
MTSQIHRAELEEPESGRWARIELRVEEGQVVDGVQESASLPLLENAVKAVLTACRGRAVAEILELTPAAFSRPDLRQDDLAFALRAIHNALLGRTH